ncbi:MAG: GDP-mannose 4,6-dehydratase [Planctomycetota bacterium]|nr:GDP-mannose 4,6-dehydratase [Planctomycetota bacterium]
MQILVTGGNGFIGSHLTEKLLSFGHQVTVVDDLSTGRRGNLDHVIDHPQLKLIHADLGDPSLIREVCEGVDVVYHLAAAVGVALIAKHPIQTIHRNIYPTQLLLEELRRIHLTGRSVSMFLASTSEVYGKNPKSIWCENDDLVFGATTKPRWSYGASKAIDEFLALACVRECQMKIVIGRFFNVSGPRQSGAYGMVLPRFVEAAMAGKALVVHDDGLQERCFAHVSDVVNAVTTLMKTESSYGRIYNIGADQPISILEMAKRVVAIVNPKATIQFQSYSQAYDDDFEDIRRRVPDLTRIREAIGYAPECSLDDIIRDVWAEMSKPAV